MGSQLVDVLAGDGVIVGADVSRAELSWRHAVRVVDTELVGLRAALHEEERMFFPWALLATDIGVATDAVVKHASDIFGVKGEAFAARMCMA